MYCWPIYLRIFGIVASLVMDSIPRIIILLGLMWDAMLKHTRVNFELLINIDMVLLIEHDITCQSDSMFQQVRASQQQIYAVIRSTIYRMSLTTCTVDQPYADFRWLVYIDDVDNFDNCYKSTL